jgi:hypothetical protein
MAGKSRQETPHLRVRIEPRLLARLEKAREMNGRTLTGEIVQRLEESFRREDQQALITATISRMLEMLDALPDNSLLKMAKYLPPEERDRFLLSLVTEPKEPKEGLLSLMTKPKEDSK